MNTKQIGSITGDNIRLIRALLGYSGQKEFAVKLGVSRVTLNLWENGKPVPLVTERAIYQLCYEKFTSVSPEDCVAQLIAVKGWK